MTPVRVAALLLMLLSAVPVSAQTITLSWYTNPEPVCAAVGQDPAVKCLYGYTVYWGTASHVYTSTADTNLATQRVFSLPSTQQYYFAVQALGNTGVSALSQEVSTTVAPPPPLLPSPECTSVPPAVSLVSETGETWSLGTATGPNSSFAILRNGQQAAGAFGRKITKQNGLKIIGDDVADVWYAWDGTVFGTTTAPTCSAPPPPQPCTFALNPTSASVGASASSGSVAVTTQLNCAWASLSTAVTWLNTVPPALGSGPGAMSYQVAANLGPARSGSLTIAGQPFVVTQAAAPPAPACPYTVSPLTLDFPKSGGPRRIVVTTSPGCAWQIASDQTWLRATPMSGTGTATITASATRNRNLARTGHYTVAGKTVTAQQMSGR